MNHRDWETRLTPPAVCTIGGRDDDPNFPHPGGPISRTRHEAPKEAGGTAHKGTSQGSAKMARPDHVPGPRGRNPKRAEALGETPGGPRHKQAGTPAGHLGQGKGSRLSMKKRT